MSEPEYLIRRATPAEASFVSDLALRSTPYWGYSADFMLACQSELTFVATYLTSHPTFVIEVEERIVGFYSLKPMSDDEVELQALFVEPASIGHGYGRALMTHAKRQAKALGYQWLIIHLSMLNRPR